MNNALKNIFLEEMENMEGIILATTNLTGNLDAAFGQLRELTRTSLLPPCVPPRPKNSSTKTGPATALPAPPQAPGIDCRAAA
jgi:hypothetical protein